MAYSASISKKYQHGLYEFTIVELEASATTEFTLTGVPDYGYVIRSASQLTAGSGSTVDPVLGRATAPAGITLITANDTAAASVDNIQTEGVPYTTLTAGTLFGRSVCGSATDNAVTTLIYIKAARP